MSMKYFACYHSILKSAEMLNDTEFGRLMRACLEYSESGTEPDLRGNERFLFPMMKMQIDSGREAYEQKCHKNSENIRKRWNSTEYDRIPNDTTNTNKKEKENKNKKENIVPLKRELEVPDSFSDELKEAVKRWSAYKAERRDAYKPQGWQALISRIESQVKIYGDEAVIELIDDCMSRGYKGIIWDILQKKPPKPQKKPTYDLDEFERLLNNYGR